MKRWFLLAALGALGAALSSQDHATTLEELRGRLDDARATLETVRTDTAAVIAEIRAEGDRARQDLEAARAEAATAAADLREQLSEVRTERDTIRTRLDAKPEPN